MADGGDLDVSGAITAAAQKYGVDPTFALNVGQAESGLNPSGPASPKGARGVMGLMPDTAASLGVDPSDPAQNIDGGVRYLKQMSDRYPGRPDLAAAAYNAGPGAVDRHGGVPPYPETQAYVAKVTGEPSGAAVMNDFETSRGEGGSASPAAPSAPVTLPDGAVLNMSQARNVNPDKGGAYTDDAGKHYTPDSQNGSGYFRDDSGALFHITPPVDPAPSDVMADFEKTKSAEPAAPSASPATVGSVAAQAGQGVLNSVAGGLSAAEMVDPVNMALHTANTIGALGDQLKNRKIDTGALFGVMTKPDVTAPQLVGDPQNFAERAGRFAGEVLPGFALGPEGETSALANLASRAKNVAYPALTGIATGEAAHAMGATPGEVSAAQALGSIPGSVAAIPSALSGIGGLVSGAAKPFLANVSTASREGQAGQLLANAAGEGFGAARSALEGYKPLVPGSPATVGDVTGNLGLIGLSRAVATKNSPEYAALTAGQNEARTASLRSLSPNADPMAVRDHIQGTLDNLDARTQGDIDAAQTAAQAKVASIGGSGNPEEYGSQIRDSVTSALKASDAREKGLWDAIDPDQSLTGNVTATRLAGKNITSNVSQYDVPMNADEQRIFGQVAAMPDVMPLKDIVALRKSINDAASTEMATNGATATYARLSALRGALGDNLANTIGDAVSKPSVATKVADWESSAGPASEVRSAAGGGNQPPAGEGPAAVSSAGGTALPAGGRLGSPAGTQGVSSEISPDLKPVMMGKQVVGYTTPTGETISAAQAKAYQSPQAAPPQAPTGAQPTIDADAQARMRAANAATAEQAQTFRQGPVAPALKTAGYAGQYTMPSGAVPGQFFKAGPTGYDSMQALSKASPEALPAIQDYAASTLRDAALAPDGTIDPKKFATWQSRYGDAIRALPADQRAAFADAATATRTVADATAARADALKTAQSGAVGKILGLGSPDAVTKTVGSILGGKNAAADMQTLVDATRNNPDAAAGLKQAVIDHVTNNYISNTEAAASGTNKIKADAYQTFLKTARPALSKVFAPDEMERLNAIGADIQRSQRTLQATKLAGGSNTAQDIYAGGLPIGGKPSTMLDFLGGALASTAGAAAHGALGAAIAEPVGMAATELIQRMRLAGINKVNDLVKQAVFDPAVFSALTAKIKGPEAVTATAGPGRALLRALIAPTSAAVATKPQSQQSSTPSALQGVM